MDLSTHLDEVLLLQGCSFVDVEAPIFPPLLVISLSSRLSFFCRTCTGRAASGVTLASNHHGDVTATLRSSRFRSVVGVYGKVRLGWILCLITPSLILSI